MTVNLTPAMPRLQSLLRMLGSENDGEALNAARAIGRTLNAVGGTFHDLADAINAAPPVAARRETAPPPWAHGGTWDQNKAARQAWGSSNPFARTGSNRKSLAPTWGAMTSDQRERFMRAAITSNKLDTWGERFLLDILDRCENSRFITLSERELREIDRLFRLAWLAGVPL